MPDYEAVLREIAEMGSDEEPRFRDPDDFTLYSGGNEDDCYYDGEQAGIWQVAAIARKALGMPARTLEEQDATETNE